MITGTIVLNSSFRVLYISRQDIGTSRGHKIVVIKNMTKDKNLSSGEELGWRWQNINQVLKK